MRIARAVVGGAGAGLLYYHGDQLNSATTLSNTAGTVFGRQVLSPFGRRLAGGTDPIGLAGQRLDATGLYHMGAREMSPLFGLFVTPDPSAAPNAERPQTLNRYAYADNSPTNLVDPTGFKAEAPTWGDRLRSFGKAIEPYVQSLGGLLSRGELGTAQSNYEGFGLALAEPVVNLYNESLMVQTGVVEPLTPVRYENDQLGGATVGTLLPLVAGRPSVSAGRGTASRGAVSRVETVQRWMSRAELDATNATGLLRGGRDGTHFVTDSANASAKRARQRMALPQTPEVRVTMEVPGDTFSAPSRVEPAFGMPGRGMERTATGRVPVKVLKVDGKP